MSQIEYSCKICKLNCVNDCVQCDDCSQWLHFNCLSSTTERLDSSVFDVDSEKEKVFSCPFCFNFEECLRRLFIASRRDWESFRRAAEMEKLCISLLQPIPFIDVDIKNIKSEVDILSDGLYKSYCSKNYFTAFKSSTDGSCFFNSCSSALYGDESQSLRLRCLALVELALNQTRIMSSLPRGILNIVDDYVDTINEVSSRNGWAGIYSMMALSSALNIGIWASYPPINGISDKTFLLANGFFSVTENPSKQIHIMYTSHNHANEDYWIPNHFVPLIPDTLKDNERPANVMKKPDSYDEPPLKLAKKDSSVDDSAPSELSTFCGDNVQNGNKMTDISQPGEAKSDTELENISFEKVSCLQPHLIPFSISNNGRFLDNQSSIQMLCNSQVVGDAIPCGVKENISFVIKNEFNVKRRLESKVSSYYDDCGQWSSGYSKTYKFGKIDDKFRMVMKQNEKYFTVSGKKLKTIDVQPTKILTIRTYSCCLARKFDYKKKITQIIEKSGDLPERLLHNQFVEYIGSFPNFSAPHGNNIRADGHYVRTNPKTIEKLKDDLKMNCPNKVYADNLQNLTMDDQPRNLQQLYNAKKQRRSNTLGSKPNIADDLQEIISRFKNGDSMFIKKMLVHNGKAPSFILYSEQQIDLIKGIVDNPNLKLQMGVDRTFNVSSAYVTLTVFKLECLISRKTRDCPILLGPILIHWDGKVENYLNFFSHLETILTDRKAVFTIRDTDITSGSDQGSALIEAIQTVFPNSSSTLCTKHVKENMDRYLSEKIGMTADDIIKIENLFFRVLLDSKDVDEFDIKSIEYISDISGNDKGLFEYLTKLTALLKKHVYQNLSKVENSLYWTNNNCESIDHVFKLFIDWEIVKLSHLIESLEKIVVSQNNEVERAFFGEGSYYLDHECSSYVFSKIAWMSLSEEKRLTIILKLLKDFKKNLTKRENNTIPSTD